MIICRVECQLLTNQKSQTLQSRWPKPINMYIGYVFDLHFLECKIQTISMISGIQIKKLILMEL